MWDPLQFKKKLDEDEKRALRWRVDSLKDKYSGDEIERIVFSELDEIGLRSEYYLDLMEEVIKEAFNV